MLRLRARRRLAGLLALGCAACACGGPGAARPNVLLVTLDTTRPDRLSAYGHRRSTSPHLDALAAESVRYTRAYATSSWTLPSHASLFTAKLPTSHGAREDPEGPLQLGDAIEGPEAWRTYRVRGLPAGETTLAEILSGAGYLTGAVVAGPWLKRVFGLDQGFEIYDDAGIDGVNGRPAAQVTDAAQRFVLGAGERPFFLFLNYFDAHTPYRPPARWAREYLGELGPRPSWVAQKRALYDAEIRGMDEEIGRLFAFLRERGLWDAALVVVTADHGDLIGEHGQIGHGQSLYEEELRIPLLVKAPRGEAEPRVADERVLITDLLPMILARLALAPPPGVQGIHPVPPGRRIVAEVYPRPGTEFYVGDWRAWIDGPLKLLWNSRGAHRLYDLERDPRESKDLAPARPQQVRALEAALQSYLAGLPPPSAAGPPGTIDAETRDALRGLGYLDPGSAPEGRPPPEP